MEATRIWEVQGQAVLALVDLGALEASTVLFLFTCLLRCLQRLIYKQSIQFCPVSMMQQGALLAALKVLQLLVSKNRLHSKFLERAARISNYSKSSLLTTSASSIWSIADLTPGVACLSLQGMT